MGRDFIAGLGTFSGVILVFGFAVLNFFCLEFLILGFFGTCGSIFLLRLQCPGAGISGFRRLKSEKANQENQENCPQSHDPILLSLRREPQVHFKEADSS